MRISITDRCNLRCRYCMPDGITLIPMEQILSYEEIVTVCEEAVSLGIRRFKITGGEPLVRKGCIDLIAEIKKIPDVEQVTMTTNGILLPNALPALKEAGLDAVNISLDTLSRERFQQISGFDRLQEVLDGIHMAVDLGLRVKLNSVLQKGINDEEWQDILELARALPLDVRFIELMPIGQGQRQEMVANPELLSRIISIYGGVEEDSAFHGNGPAVYYRIPGFRGSVGLISALHGKFCASCNRIRMTSTGEIKPCLCYEKSYSVRQAVREQNRMEIRRILEEAIGEKPQMHCFEDKDGITEQKKMVQIGG